MRSGPLEFNLSLPPEPRYLALLRDVVANAARQAGCGDAVADAFAESVDRAAQSTAPDADARVAIAVRQTDGTIQVDLGTGAAMRSLSVRA
jgi:hypothetical protein